MDLNMDKIRRMQAEMARFENEISGPMFRPPMPRFAHDISLRFIPHALHRQPGGATYAPPMPPVPGGRPLRPPFMPPNFHGFIRPRAPVIPAPTGSAVIEAAPTKYTAASISSQNAAPSTVGIAPSVYQDLSAQQSEPSPASSTQTSAAPTSAAATLSSVRLAKLQDKTKKAVAIASTSATSKVQPPKQYVRTAGGEIWKDPSLLEWDPNDYRLFCGDLGNEVSDELLAKAFRKYASFQKAKVIREKRTNKTKGFGFVSFKDPQDFIRAVREMDGKYVGNRPIKLRKSNWKDRNLKSVKKKEKEKKKLGLKR